MLPEQVSVALGGQPGIVVVLVGTGEGEGESEARAFTKLWKDITWETTRQAFVLSIDV